MRNAPLCGAFTIGASAPRNLHGDAFLDDPQDFESPWRYTPYFSLGPMEFQIPPLRSPFGAGSG